MMRAAGAALAAALLVALPAHAETFVGRASVVDGDTIEIHGQRIRIFGVDAPESRQVCADESGAAYRCGQRAALAFADWLDGAQPITCVERDRDRYRRVVASCTRGGADVAEWLARSGLALDWPRYSHGRYAAAQDAAQAEKAGIWRGEFTLPWLWRRAR